VAILSGTQVVEYETAPTPWSAPVAGVDVVVEVGSRRPRPVALITGESQSSHLQRK
jgi:hypothetical protein